VNGVTVVDDYGHHPTEIRETLAAARQVWKDRIIVVFQPHRYTRTQKLFNEFLTAFLMRITSLSRIFMQPVKKPIEGVSAASLCEGIRAHGHQGVIYLSGFDDMTDHLLAIAKPSDVSLRRVRAACGRLEREFLKRVGKKNKS